MTEKRRRGRPPLEGGALTKTSVALPADLLDRVRAYGSLTLPGRPEWNQIGTAPKRGPLLRELIEKGLDTFDRAQKRNHKLTSRQG